MDGTNADQLTIRADWPGPALDNDVDVWLFEAGVLPERDLGAVRLTASGEYLTTLATPNTDYVVYAATFKGVPLHYSLPLL